MYIVGIDIGKNHHEASIVSPEGKQIGPSLRFATTHKGADSLMSFIFKNIGNSPCVFGMEATGHYWYPIYSFLKAKGYTIYVINPIQSDSLRKMYIRQTKNDSIDSFLIAEVIRFGQFRTTSMGILEKYLTPENIENAPIDELFEIIKDKSHNRLTRAKAISIKEAAAVLESQGAAYRNLSIDSSSDAGKYASNIMAFPTTILVDRNGNIVGDPMLGGIDNQDNYDALMKQIQSIIDADSANK